MKRATKTDVEIGKRVRRVREQLGFSQEKLGKAVGITFQQIQKYENGTNRISVSRLVDIAKVFDLDYSNFLRGL